MSIGPLNDKERAEVHRLKEAFKAGGGVASLSTHLWDYAKSQALQELREELAAASAAATDLAAAALRAARQSWPMFRLGYITALEDIERTGLRPWRNAEKIKSAAAAFDRYVKDGPGA